MLNSNPPPEHPPRTRPRLPPTTLRKPKLHSYSIFFGSDLFPMSPQRSRRGEKKIAKPTGTGLKKKNRRVLLCEIIFPELLKSNVNAGGHIGWKRIKTEKIKKRIQTKSMNNKVVIKAQKREEKKSMKSFLYWLIYIWYMEQVIWKITSAFPLSFPLTTPFYR